MARRTKQEIKRADELIKIFLGDAENNPSVAWNNCKAFYASGSQDVPCFIKGLYDFRRVAKGFATQYKYNVDIEQAKKNDKVVVEEYLDKVLSLNEDNYSEVKDLYKETKNSDYKMALADLMFYIKSEDKKDWKFGAEEIKIFVELGIV